MLKFRVLKVSTELFTCNILPYFVLLLYLSLKYEESYLNCKSFFVHLSGVYFDENNKTEIKVYNS